MFMDMKDCVDPAGHLWVRPRYRLSPYYSQPETHFSRPEDVPPDVESNGRTSTLMKCAREGCDEIGYLIQEVAQNSGREEVSS